MVVFYKLSFISPAMFQNLCLWCHQTARAVPPPRQRTELSGFGFWCPWPDICQSEASVQRSDSRSLLISLVFRHPLRPLFTPVFSWLHSPLLVWSVQSWGWKISCDSLALCYTAQSCPPGLHLNPVLCFSNKKT